MPSKPKGKPAPPPNAQSAAPPVGPSSTPPNVHPSPPTARAPAPWDGVEDVVTLPIDQQAPVSPFIPPKTSMKVREVNLRGPHILLVPLRADHVRYLFPDALEPGLFQHLEPGTEGGLKPLREWIARRVEEANQGTALPFLQVDPARRKAFGCTSIFNISPAHFRCEVGHTWLCKSHRGTTANAEAKLLLLTHIFEEMGAIRVQFKADTRNEAAVRSLERMGAVREGRMRSERVLSDGYIRDAYVYSVIRSEWPAVKTRLNGLIWGSGAAA